MATTPPNLPPGITFSIPKSHGHNIGIDTRGTGIGIYGSGTGIGIYAAGTGISIQANGGTETRPRNVALLAIIKY